MKREWSRDMASIPNRDGTRVDVLLRDGTEITTVVECVDGLHRLRHIGIARVIGWRFAWA